MDPQIQQQISPILDPLQKGALDKVISIPYTTTLPSFNPKQNGFRTVYYDGTDYWLYIYANNGWRSQKLGVTGASGKFGGTGVDGALSISSGTTTIDLASAAVVIKNYTSISITGTANIAFTNPSSYGSIVIFKSQGNVTITSTATSVMDLTGQGANVGYAPTSFALLPNAGNAGTYQGAGGATAKGLHTLGSIGAKYINMYVGAPGGNPGYQYGGIGVGGRGGGSFYCECAGALTISSTFVSKGDAGTQTSDSGATGGDGGGGSSYNDGLSGNNNTLNPFGGGGAGGVFVFCTNTLTSNTATFTTTGGNGRSSSVGKGGDGNSAVFLNTEFF